MYLNLDFFAFLSDEYLLKHPKRQPVKGFHPVGVYYQKATI